MASDLDPILDDLFHGCAFAAFVEQAMAEGGWPGPDATRNRAYRHYEQALADRGLVRSSGLPTTGTSASQPA